MSVEFEKNEVGIDSVEGIGDSSETMVPIFLTGTPYVRSVLPGTLCSRSSPSGFVKRVVLPLVYLRSVLLDRVDVSWY